MTTYRDKDAPDWKPGERDRAEQIALACYEESGAPLPATDAEVGSVAPSVRDRRAGG